MMMMQRLSSYGTHCLFSTSLVGLRWNVLQYIHLKEIYNKFIENLNIQTKCKGESNEGEFESHFCVTKQIWRTQVTCVLAILKNKSSKF
jgi:hypothetical protein